MDTFYCSKSAGEKGTLYNIKAKFGHRNVKPKVMANVQRVYDLVNFTAEGFTCLLCCEILGIKSLNEIPVGAPDIGEDKVAKEKFMDETVSQMLEVLKPKVAFSGRDFEDVPVDRDEGDKEDKEPDTFCSCNAPFTGFDGKTRLIVTDIPIQLMHM